MDASDVKISGKKPLYRGHFRLDLYRFRHRLHAGGWSKTIRREVFDRGGAVSLLLYDPDRDAVVLVEQFRLPALLGGGSGWQIEPVAGLLDHPGEDETAVARREAREEAGLKVAGELVPIHRILPSPGALTELVALYCARADSRRAGGIHGLAAEGEDIRVVVKPFRDAMRMLRAGEIANAHCVIALYWLAANRARLKRRWAQPARRKPRLAAKSSRA
ncbi:MAG TPA: NUDIX domain-containing protein [Stellaceae bacterium]|jgi:ADP-ribose pyrophosphatase|nr:NUDIX domain-containing protein [Stellaceae bacterium]